MITKLHIENFKCHKSQRFDFPGISLLLGPNSSGKSSVIQAALTLMQSKDFPKNLTLNGQYAQLGDLSNITNNNDTEKLVRIDANFIQKGNAKLNVSSYWSNDSKNLKPKLNSGLIEFKKIKLKIKRNKRYSVQLESSGDPSEIMDEDRFSFMTKIYKSIDSIIEDEVTKKTTKNEKKSKISKVYPEQEIKNYLKGKSTRFSSQSDSLEKALNRVKDKANFLSLYVFPDLSNFIRTERLSCNYLGGFRDAPSRTYQLDFPNDLKVGFNGQGFQFQLLRWQENNSDEINVLIEIGEKLRLFEDIKVVPILGGQIQVQVKPFRESRFVNLSDVGFGLSQVLPIFVADCQLKEGSTLYLSQPELHLHPHAQSLLGDYFSLNFKKRNKQYIIETHSEYLINRLRLNVAKGVLREKDVNAYYFSKEIDGDVKSNELFFNKGGEIINAPEDYFTTYMTDVIDIAMSVGNE